MKKIEIIWRELLFQALEKKNLPAGKVGRHFTQKEVAKKFGFSTSTVFQALKVPRKMGAVRVTGRNFILEDAEKLLYHWASFRSLEKEIRLLARVNLSIFDIEARMPPQIVFGGYTAACKILGLAPADYDVVYVYANNLDEIQKRFEIGKSLPFRKGVQANLVVLAADKYLTSYGKVTTLAQTFVDIWNLPVWYAKEFTKSLKEKIDELLS